MPAPIANRRESPEDAVRAANHRFYAAFEGLDLAAMDSVWAHDDTVQCVHPGWELLLGWDEIETSWARIFASTRRIRISLSSVWTRVEGEVAWVTCTEHVTTAFDEGFDEATVQATNVFILRDGQWLLAARHASPLPASARPVVQ